MDEEINRIRQDSQIEESAKSVKMKAERYKSIAVVLEEVEVLIDTHFHDEFSETKSSLFLKKVVENRNLIDMASSRSHGSHRTACQRQ